MVLNEISSKIKRTIRGINIKDTLGMHYYKLGAVGMAYWEIRLKEAKDLDEASYCRAQLEKCKIDRARRNIEQDPEIIALKEEKQKLLKELEELYKSFDISESEMNDNARAIHKAMSDIDNKIQAKITAITNDLNARWENLNFYYESSDTSGPSVKSTISWNEIKKKPKEENMLESGTSNVLKNVPVSRALSEEKEKILGSQENGEENQNEENLDNKQKQLEEEIEQLKQIKIATQKSREGLRRVIASKKEYNDKTNKIAKQEKALKELNEILGNVERLLKNIGNIREHAGKIDVIGRELKELASLEQELEKNKNDNNLNEEEKKVKLEELDKKIQEAKEKLAKSIGKDKDKLKSVDEERKFLKNRTDVLFRQIEITFDAKGNVKKITPQERKLMDKDKYLNILNILEKNKDGIVKSLSGKKEELEKDIETNKERMETISVPSDEEYASADESLKMLTKQEQFYDEQIAFKEKEREKILQKVRNDVPTQGEDVAFEKLKSTLQKQVESGAITIEDLQKIVNGLEKTKNKNKNNSKEDDRSSI